MKSNKILLGFIAGAALGTIAAILLAPDKGKNTRATIVGKTGGFLNDFKAKYNKAIDNLTTTLDSVAYAEEKDATADDNTAFNGNATSTDGRFQL